MVREVEWDDTQAAQMDALAVHQAGMCPCGCGLPVEVSTQKQAFATTKVICHARRALDMAYRDAAQLAKPPAERDPAWKQGVPDPMDGVMFSVVPHQPKPKEAT